MDSTVIDNLYKKLLEIKNKIKTFEKDLLIEKTKQFVELKKEENKLLAEILELNKKTIEQTKESNLDSWTLLHSP